MYEHYKEAFRRYADFDGKTSREGFWGFVLVHILVQAALIVSLIMTISNGSEVLPILLGVALGATHLLSMVPATAAAVRRMRDTGRSPWFLLFTFIPSGIIVVLILLAQRSAPTSGLSLHDYRTRISEDMEPVALPQYDGHDDEYV